MAGISKLPREYEKRVLDYLNKKETGNRVHDSIDSIELVDGSYRVETNFTDKFVLEPYEDIGVYYIDQDIIDRG